MLASRVKNANKIKPLFDRVLLKFPTEDRQISGIIVPKTADDRSHVMTVEAIGNTQSVKIGDRVIVAKYAGTEVMQGTDKFLLVTEYDILGMYVSDLQGGEKESIPRPIESQRVRVKEDE